MDERRQPDNGTGQADASAWRVNGARGVVGADGAGWSSAGAALEPDPEPLALLTAGHGGQARHRQLSAPGLDDDTPVSGMPAVEPPLWREATRHRPVAGSGAQFGEYRSASAPASVADLVGPGPADRLAPVGTDRLDPPDRVADPEDGPAEFGGLPQRVPAEPDVPVSGDPEPSAGSPAGPAAGRDRWTAPELAWIADQLRRDDVPGEAPTGSFDVDAVVAAVREVPGVQAASVRTNPTGMHTLRLDLADEADPGQVSRAVARLLLERMGLSASPQDVPQVRGGAEPSAAEPGPPVAEPGSWAAVPVAEPGASVAEPGSWAAVPVAEPGPSVAEPGSWAPPLARDAPDAGPELPPGHVRPEPVAPAAGAPPVGGAGPEPELAAGEPAWPEGPLGAGGEPRPPSVPAPERGAEDGWQSEEELDDFAVPGDDQPIPEQVSRPLHVDRPGPRVVIDQVQVRTVGLEAAVEVLLTAGDRPATGVARGPAVDSFLLRLAAIAAARAIDSLLRGVADPNGPSRCFVEHTGVFEFGNTEVAVVVLLLVCGGWVEQLTGSALVDGDPRQAVVRATLGAVNRRLEALLD